MNHLIEVLTARTGPLVLFGYYNLAVAAIFLILTRISKVRVRGANAWFKPFKFALSIAIFSWTMGWYTFDLPAPEAVSVYNWVVIGTMGFVVVYISIQAGRGQLSHYNSSTPLYGFLLFLMGISAVAVTLWTGYIGILFCSADFPGLPVYYVLSIRLAIFIFVIFAFQGASMGARQTHTVGGPEGGPSVPITDWSTRYGDLRIAHFIGLHALQVLPLLSWFVLKNTAATALAGVLYGTLAMYVWVRATRGKTLFAARRMDIAGS
jgi:hypothetical protein